MKKEMIILLILIVLIIDVSALYVEEDSKISFGHVLRVKNISVSDMSPGEAGVIKINLKNSGTYSITDLRAKLTLPSQVQFIDDVNEIRIAEIKEGGEKEIEYKIIALPTATEGIYGVSLLVDYITHHGANAVNIGEENQDNYTFGVIIKSDPSIFMQLESADIYEGKLIGDISLKFVNNGTSDIKFLTLSLIETGDYEIISDSQYYIGDLDSDDFSSAKFNLKIKAKKESINIPVKISYRDSMNNHYSQEFNSILKIRKASELGKSNGNYLMVVIILIAIAAGIGYYFYIRNKKRKSKYKN